MQPETFDTWLNEMPYQKGLPFVVEPKTLYSVKSLYRGYDPRDASSLNSCTDMRIFNWFTEAKIGDPHKIRRQAAVVTRLHDTAIGAEVVKFLATYKSVGFMGGHDVKRTDEAFVKIAEIARDLRRRNFMVISGGGPGLMEAANFGAFMAPYDDTAFSSSLSVLSAAPDYSQKDNWLKTAAAVREELVGAWNKLPDQDSWSLGVPTWLYGTEPPNLFSTHIGKYFYNSLREDGLVTICNAGIVFGRGSAGTVQEIFQDTTLNFYRGSNVSATPMILFGASYWNPRNGASTRTLTEIPVYPLLESFALGAHNPFNTRVLLTDSQSNVVDFIVKANGDPVDLENRRATLTMRAERRVG